MDKQKAPDDSRKRIVGRIVSDVRPDSVIRTAIGCPKCGERLEGGKSPAAFRIIASRPQKSS